VRHICSAATDLTLHEQGHRTWITCQHRHLSRDSRLSGHAVREAAHHLLHATAGALITVSQEPDTTGLGHH
jgi:hypothetical protein